MGSFSSIVSLLWDLVDRTATMFNITSTLPEEKKRIGGGGCPSLLIMDQKVYMSLPLTTNWLELVMWLHPKSG